MAEVKGHLGSKEIRADANINCSLKNLGFQGEEKQGPEKVVLVSFYLLVFSFLHILGKKGLPLLENLP